jgi:type VI protein secretion system component VasF
VSAPRVRSFNREALAALSVADLLGLVGRLDALTKPADPAAWRRLLRHRRAAAEALALALGVRQAKPVAGE